MNQLPHATRAALKRMLAAGATNLMIQDVLGLSHATITKYNKLWAMSALCPCGEPAGHRGWCSYRLAFSPARRGWLAEHWEARSESRLAATVDAALMAAKAKGHRMGRFMWGTAHTTTLAYTLCAVCGRKLDINRTYGRREHFDGSATEKQCFTKTEIAAQKAAYQERRRWREAKRTLRAIRTTLRPPRSRTTASVPGPTSAA